MDIDSALRESIAVFKRGDYRAAVESLTIFLKAKPGCTEALYYRGMSHWHCEDFEAAMTDLHAVLQAEPRHKMARVGYATALGEAKGICQAFVNEFHTLVEHYPEDSASWSAYGSALFHLQPRDNASAAARAAETAISLDPLNYPAFAVLASCKLNKGERESAEEDLYYAFFTAPEWRRSRDPAFEPVIKFLWGTDGVRCKTRANLAAPEPIGSLSFSEDKTPNNPFAVFHSVDPNPLLHEWRTILSGNTLKINQGITDDPIARKTTKGLYFILAETGKGDALVQCGICECEKGRWVASLPPSLAMFWTLLGMLLDSSPWTPDDEISQRYFANQGWPDPPVDVFREPLSELFPTNQKLVKLLRAFAVSTQFLPMQSSLIEQLVDLKVPWEDRNAAIKQLLDHFLFFFQESFTPALYGRLMRSIIDFLTYHECSHAIGRHRQVIQRANDKSQSEMKALHWCSELAADRNAANMMMSGLRQDLPLPQKGVCAASTLCILMTTLALQDRIEGSSPQETHPPAGMRMQYLRNYLCRGIDPSFVAAWDVASIAFLDKIWWVSTTLGLPQLYAAAQDAVLAKCDASDTEFIESHWDEFLNRCDAAGGRRLAPGAPWWSVDEKSGEAETESEAP